MALACMNNTLNPRHFAETPLPNIDTEVEDNTE